MDTKIIKRLDGNLISRLRSGVNVSNVAQCVEELVLNSVDAGSTCIAVRLDLPFYKIQVVDNGRGIEKNNLKYVGKRYHTSKCYSFEDLKCLQNYGFRGEAIASLREMSAVLEIVTRSRESRETLLKRFVANRKEDTENDDDDEKGNKSYVTLSKSERPSCGTTITIIDFMFKMPVRKQQICSIRDLEYCRQRLVGVALMHPNISFSLRNDSTGDICLQTKKTTDTFHSFRNIFGSRKASSLKSINFARDCFLLNGYVSLEGHYSKDLQFCFVNRRLILKSQIHRIINRILAKYFSNKATANKSEEEEEEESPKMKGDQNGIYFLNLTCPSDVYDISFDPRKTLVEFQNWKIAKMVYEEALEKFLKEEADFIFHETNKEDFRRDEFPPNKKRIGLTSIKSEHPRITTSNVRDALISLPAKRPFFKKLPSSPPPPPPPPVEKKKKIDSFLSFQSEENRKERLEKTRVFFPANKTSLKTFKKKETEFSSSSSSENEKAESLMTKIKPLSTADKIEEMKSIFKYRKIKTLTNIRMKRKSELINRVERLKKSTRTKQLNHIRFCHELSKEINLKGTTAEERAADRCSESNSKIRKIDHFENNSTKFESELNSIQLRETDIIRVKKNATKNVLFKCPLTEIIARSCWQSETSSKSFEEGERIEENDRELFETETFESHPIRLRKQQSNIESTSPKDSPGRPHEEEGARYERNPIKVDGFLVKEYYTFSYSPTNDLKLASSLKLDNLRRTFDAEASSEETILQSPQLQNSSQGFSIEFESSPQNNSWAQIEFSEPIFENCATLNSSSREIIENNKSSPRNESDQNWPPNENAGSHLNEDWMLLNDPETSTNLYIHKKTGNSTFEKPQQQNPDQIHVEVDAPAHFFLSHDSGQFLANPNRKKKLPQNPETVKEISKLLNGWKNPVFENNISRNILSVSNELKLKSSVRVYSSFQNHKFYKSMFQKIQVIGQVDCKFIACLTSTHCQDEQSGVEEEELLVLFDQHAIHERIRIEQLTKELYTVPEEEEEESFSGSIRFSHLRPFLILELDSECRRLSHLYQLHFEKLGIKLQFQDDDRIWAMTAPSCLLEREVNEMKRGRRMTLRLNLENIIKEELNRILEKCVSTLPKTLQNILNSQACHGAIKFGDELSLEDCRDLIGELKNCSLPFQCAHGRPALVPLFRLSHLQKPLRWKKPIKPKFFKLNERK